MPSTARLIEFSDREFLHLVDDLTTDKSEWVTTQQIAMQITGIADEDDSRLIDANRGVGSRLAWMRRFGVIERHPEGAWRINEVGAQFLRNGLRSDVSNGLERLKDAEMVEVMRRLSDRYSGAGRSTAIFMRREWTRGTRAT